MTKWIVEVCLHSCPVHALMPLPTAKQATFVHPDSAVTWCAKQSYAPHIAVQRADLVANSILELDLFRQPVLVGEPLHERACCVAAVSPTRKQRSSTPELYRVQGQPTQGTTALYA